MTDPGKTFQGINDATRTSDFESLKYAIDILNIPPGKRKLKSLSLLEPDA